MIDMCTHWGIAIYSCCVGMSLTIKMSSKNKRRSVGVSSLKNVQCTKMQEKIADKRYKNTNRIKNKLSIDVKFDSKQVNI